MIPEQVAAIPALMAIALAQGSVPATLAVASALFRLQRSMTLDCIIKKNLELAAVRSRSGILERAESGLACLLNVRDQERVGKIAGPSLETAENGLRLQNERDCGGVSSEQRPSVLLLGDAQSDGGGRGEAEGNCAEEGSCAETQLSEEETQQRCSTTT